VLLAARTRELVVAESTVKQLTKHSSELAAALAEMERSREKALYRVEHDRDLIVALASHINAMNKGLT
jgi:ABC-type branched-subunit amino acid transport system ATPase component